MGSLAGGFRFDFDDDDDTLGWSGIADDGSEEEGADFFPMVGKGVGSDCRWARVGARGVVFEPGSTRRCHHQYHHHHQQSASRQQPSHKQQRRLRAAAAAAAAAAARRALW
jgi:hypothetical protein